MGGALDDLRAGRATPDRPAQAARLVHPPPAGGIRGLWRDHRGRHRHAPEHRRRAAARAERRPHAADDRGRDATRGRPRRRAGPPGRAGRHRNEPVRDHPGVPRLRGGRLHDDAAHRPGIQPPPERRPQEPLRRSHARAPPRRLLGAPALGDARGRVAAAPARRRARLRRRLHPPADLRGLMGEREQDQGRIGPDTEDDGSLIRAVPGLARIAAAASWRSARWTAKASKDATERVIKAATTGQEPAELFRSTGAEIRERTRRVLGIQERPEERVAMNPDAALAEREEARQSLRERGAELLRRSADVNLEEDSHPAYTRILEDLAPDEARILRLLHEGGPQPSVDVRSGVIPLQSTSELVAAGLNMIGPEAGCRHLDDVPAYLNNLFRLGLIWFSREPEGDAALEASGQTRTVRRSIHLTPFGRDFCELCLSPEPGEPDPGESRDGH